MLHKIIGSDQLQVVLNKEVVFTSSGDLVRDIQRARNRPMSSVILFELFLHYQPLCNDSAAYLSLCKHMFEEIHMFLYPRISYEALRFLNERIYGNTENTFVIDNNIRALLPICSFYTRDIEHGFFELLSPENLKGPILSAEEHTPDTSVLLREQETMYFPALHAWYSRIMDPGTNSIKGPDISPRPA